jgi:hypothetical protein|tara:strand:+ start:858 stop:2159 length:1302 start_codon:yes stop_codon:yes gene_type:complete
MIKKYLIVFLLISSSIVFGQRTTSSPYSFFGIGEEFSSRTIEQASMGGIGVAFNSSQYLNFTNPAAYSDLRFTTYSFGLLSKELTVKTNDASQTVNSTSLSYFALAFPIGKNAGFSLGMQPLSSVGYSLSNTTLDADGDPTEISIFSGNGGVNRIYGSFGMKVYKGLSLGIEADFSFGSTENILTNQIANVVLATRYNESSTIRGGNVKLGAQYSKRLKNKLILNFGSTLKFGSDLDVSGTERFYTLSLSATGAEIIRDEQDEVAIEGIYSLPVQTIFGFGIGKLDKWHAGFEYESQKAIKASGFLNRTGNTFKYDASNRISFGGYYTPKATSISSYWDRVTYRAGMRYENTGLLIDGSGLGSNFSKVNDFGMSFGLGLPLGRKLSNINLGFEFGKKGTINNNLIQENYFNLRIGLSLNAVERQAWFQKRRID